MESMYMVALMPQEELRKEIYKEQKLFSENYNAVEAIRRPVHITMVPPFKTTKDIKPMVRGLAQWAKIQVPFQLELNNYDFFPYAHVVYIDVVKNNELSALYRNFNKEMNRYILFEPGKKSPFHPHITIGYRDVSPEVFPDVVTEYSNKKFEATLNCNAIYLWKHTGKEWRVEAEFVFYGSPSNQQQLELF